MSFHQAVERNTSVGHDSPATHTGRNGSMTHDVERQSPASVRKRFLQINHDRLRRTRIALDHQQDVFLGALPLLFHCNHPMLPGFVSHNTPAGISGFKPGRSDIHYGKAIARSFFLSSQYSGEDIWSIFMMGSVGTLAQSSHSDFDIWLCHRPGLSRTALAELEQKCQRISKWAKTLRLDVHIFLMDCEAFRAGQLACLDSESSGSAQRLLLLDEFYRTALHIAGRHPLWWFVPASHEVDYNAESHELVNKRFIRPNSVIDFGPVAPIPDGEFIGAGIWQLYKAISSPYKSVLKLLLLESYVHDYPNITPLALEYKQHLYQGDLHINELDPYVLIYRRIERYLTQLGDMNRLDLVRRCLYFKVNKPLSRASTPRNKSWQHELMETLVADWGWTPDYMRMLDQRGEWKPLRVKEERNQLVQALNSSYGMLLDFAQRSRAARAISADELNELGRKLQASFERRPGKLDWINPGISKDLSEPALALVEQRAENEPPVWQLHAWEGEQQVLLRQSQSPVELLFWSYLNGIAAGHVRLDASRAPSARESQLRRTLVRLRQWLPLPMAAPSRDAFKRPAAPTHVLLLLNVAAETPSPYGTHVHRLSSNSDPLCYGALEENLVASVDLVVRNSWQEITCERFEGSNALIQALHAYVALCLPGTHQSPPKWEIDCLGTTQTALIAHRVRHWFHDVCACYYGGKPPTARYVFCLGPRYYSLQFQGAKLVVLNHKDPAQLMQYLGEGQSRYSPIVVDSAALHDHPLKALARRVSGNAIQVFFQRQQGFIDIYVSDERGSLVQFMAENASARDLLSNLHVFFRKALRRCTKALNVDFGVHPIEFYELHQEPGRHWSVIPRLIPPQPGRLDLRARVVCNDQGQFEYDLYCEQQLFAWEQFKHDVFYAAAQYLLHHLGESDNYLISDLDLDACREQLSSKRELQVSHYLRAKIDLERQLLAASRTLL